LTICHAPSETYNHPQISQITQIQKVAGTSRRRNIRRQEVSDVSQWKLSGAVSACRLVFVTREARLSFNRPILETLRATIEVARWNHLLNLDPSAEALGYSQTSATRMSNGCAPSDSSPAGCD